MQHARRLTLIATILGSSLAFVDASVVNIALPTIQDDFRVGLAGLQWIVLSYSLALASLYLLGGALGDRLGLRRTFVAGVAAFVAASALAGASTGTEMLIVARSLQGVAGALLTPSSLALLRATYGDDAGKAIGQWSAWSGITTVAGPPAGGALVEWASWRWIFFLNLPLGALAVLLALRGRSNEEAAPQPPRPLDIPGAVAAAIGFGTMTYALIEGASHGFGRAVVVASLAIAGLALAAFVTIEARSREPMLPLSLFRIRNFAYANLETLLLYGALGAGSLYLVLYLQSGPGYTPFEASWLTAPISVIMLLLAGRFGALADRHGPRLYLTAGAALTGVSQLLFLLVGEEKDLARVLPGIVVFGVGLAMFVAPITSTALKSVPQDFSGIAAGVNTTFSRLGSLLAIALAGLVVSRLFHAHAPDGTPLARNEDDPVLRHASTVAFHGALLFAAGLAFAAAAVAAVGISDEEARASSE